MAEFTVHAVHPDRLARIREHAVDESGNRLLPFDAQGWEPLRCCLRSAAPAERIALISFSPFTTKSVWSETGPVFIHAELCGGYDATAGLPEALRTGPRVLRPYAYDGAIAYDHIVLVPDNEDIEPALHKILGEPDVAVVHIRAALAQCYTYAVSR